MEGPLSAAGLGLEIALQPPNASPSGQIQEATGGPCKARLNSLSAPFPRYYLACKTSFLLHNHPVGQLLPSSVMASDKGRPLPKFGEWDVNNPASAEGFTVIFNKARDEKKTSAAQVKIVTPRKNDGSLRNGAGYNTVNEHYPKYPPPKVTNPREAAHEI
ncbi:hypothetical protein ACFX1S_015436 [Malus domestica]